MLSQVLSPLDANPTESAEERAEMTRMRSEIRGRIERAERCIRDCDSIDEDNQRPPRLPIVVRGEKLQ